MQSMITFTCFALVLAIFAQAMPINGEIEIYDSVVRLHVLANSDSEQDQQLKLKVRDAVLECLQEEMTEFNTVLEAKSFVDANTEKIENAAKACIAENGYAYDVAVETGIEKYPERNYGSVSLPSGDYYSVRVKIGCSAGKNWWCVLFPPLCVGAATVSEPEEELAAVGLTSEEVNIITKSDDPKYEIKFKLLEFFKKTFV